LVVSGYHRRFGIHLLNSKGLNPLAAAEHCRYFAEQASNCLSVASFARAAKYQNAREPAGQGSGWPSFWVLFLGHARKSTSRADTERIKRTAVVGARDVEYPNLQFPIAQQRAKNLFKIDSY